MGRGAWQATVQGCAKNRTRLKQLEPACKSKRGHLSLIHNPNDQPLPLTGKTVAPGRQVCVEQAGGGGRHGTEPSLSTPGPRQQPFPGTLLLWAGHHLWASCPPEGPACPAHGQQITDFPESTPSSPSQLTLNVPALLPYLVHQPLWEGRRACH